MVEIENYDDSDFLYRYQHHQHGTMTQEAANALIGFGAASGERKMMPKEKFKHWLEEKQETFNSQSGNITGLSDEEVEEEENIMFDFNDKMINHQCKMILQFVVVCC